MLCRFEDQLTGCVSTVISHGFNTIMLTPHLDNAVQAYQWRNYLKLDPSQKIDGYSYWDIQVGRTGIGTGRGVAHRETHRDTACSWTSRKG